MSHFEDMLDELDEMVDLAWNLPMTGGKCVVDGEKIRERLENIRLNFPQEMKKAKDVLEERERLISKANQDATIIVAEAERVREKILNEQIIMKEARENANAIMEKATEESERMRNAAIEFINSALSKTEELLEVNLAKVKQARTTINT